MGGELLSITALSAPPGPHVLDEPLLECDLLLCLLDVVRVPHPAPDLFFLPRLEPSPHRLGIERVDPVDRRPGTVPSLPVPEPLVLAFAADHAPAIRLADRLQCG